MTTRANRRLSPHTATAAIAAAVASIVSPLIQSVGSDKDVQAVQDIARPAAEDLVWIFGPINQQQTYTVPQGKNLVITGANAAVSGDIPFRIDGGPERRLFAGYDSTAQLGNGLRIAPGQTITLDPAGWRSLFGYLVDA